MEGLKWEKILSLSLLDKILKKKKPKQARPPIILDEDCLFSFH